MEIIYGMRCLCREYNNNDNRFENGWTGTANEFYANA